MYNVLQRRLNILAGSDYGVSLLEENYMDKLASQRRFVIYKYGTNYKGKFTLTEQDNCLCDDELNERIIQPIMAAVNAKWRKEKRMTREEAEKKLQALGCSTEILIQLQVLGLLKFEEEKIEVWFETTSKILGVIRLEKWPEGIVLWIGGMVVYRSWKS